MRTLIVGATGATGRLLVEQLLKRGQQVRAIVRSPEKLSTHASEYHHLSLIQASLLDLTDAEMAQHVNGCYAVASCLGHSMSLQGIFGPPRRLVTDATRRLCRAIQANDMDRPTRFVLMNTAGNRNRDLDEPISLRERAVAGLFRRLLPPHVDNERAADYLRSEIGQQHEAVEWVAVRPDNLVDEGEVTPYGIYPSPIHSAMFGSGSTSRINVADFMARLITEDGLWHQWKGQMPVLYNEAPS